MKTLTVSVAVLLAAALLPPPANAEDFPGESAYDNTVYPDEALVNLHIRNSRWPDCWSLETAIADIFRLEGCTDGPDATEAKAMATWRWLNTLMSRSGGRVFEGNPTGTWVRFSGDPTTDQIEVRRGDKLIQVYGTHECGGLSRCMVNLWRAAGYLGYDEPSSGHSVACLRYPDKDGIWRMHSFNPQGLSYYWNPQDNRVGSRRCPVMTGVEYKALMPPLQHTLRTSLRIGETVRRRWQNDDMLQMTERMSYWKKRSEKNNWASRCVAGQEDQTLVAAVDPVEMAAQLYPGSTNTVATPAAKAGPVLHPAEAGKPAAFIYRLASPYVAIEAAVEATLTKGAAEDTCRLSFSTDMGKTWHPLVDKQTVGTEKVTVEVGRKQYLAGEPSITSSYNFLVKAEFATTGRPASVGMDGLKITVHRQLNIRALPNLMPGLNVLCVNADRIPRGYPLQLVVEYEVNGEPKRVIRTITQFPFYFQIDVTGIPAEKLATPYYLANWGGEDNFNVAGQALRMNAIQVQLLCTAGHVNPDASLPAAVAELAFAKAYPIPNHYERKMINATKIPKYESEVSGFFPQLPREADQPTDPREYCNWLIDHVADGGARIAKCPEGADPIEYLTGLLPKAHGIHTLNICAVLSEMPDKRAIPALLAKWATAPDYGPGTRYIPDALAAIGDRSVVPALAKRARELRLDYRIHIVHALGILGGEQARKTIEDLAKNDPSISVRGEAARTLATMKQDIP